MEKLYKIIKSNIENCVGCVVKGCEDSVEYDIIESPCGVGRKRCILDKHENNVLEPLSEKDIVRVWTNLLYINKNSSNGVKRTL
jgi:hypothetical protein